MKVEIYNGIPNHWDEYVLKHKQANVYHLYSWGLFLKEYYNLIPLNLVAYDGNKISGIVPLVIMKNYTMKNIIISLPYFCIGGILADNESVERLLLEKIKELTIKYKCDYTLLRSERINDQSIFDHVDKEEE